MAEAAGAPEIVIDRDEPRAATAPAPLMLLVISIKQANEGPGIHQGVSRRNLPCWKGLSFRISPYQPRDALTRQTTGLGVRLCAWRRRGSCPKPAWWHVVKASAWWSGFSNLIRGQRPRLPLQAESRCERSRETNRLTVAAPATARRRRHASSSRRRARGWPRPGCSRSECRTRSCRSAVSRGRP